MERGLEYYRTPDLTSPSLPFPFLLLVHFKMGKLSEVGETTEIIDSGGMESGPNGLNEVFRGGKFPQKILQ